MTNSNDRAAHASAKSVGVEAAAKAVVPSGTAMPPTATPDGCPVEQDFSELWDSVARLTQQGRWHDACVTLRAVANSTGSRAVRISLGTLFAERGNLHAAVREWTQVLDAAATDADRPSRAVVMHNLAAVYRELGDYRLAAHFQRQALNELDAGGTWELLQLANDALADQRLDLAELLLDSLDDEAWEPAADAGSLPDDAVELAADLQATRGLLAGLRGELTAARRHLRAALRAHRQRGDIQRVGKDLVNLAAICLHDHRADLAMPCLHRAIADLEAAGETIVAHRARHLLRQAQRLQHRQQIDPRWN